MLDSARQVPQLRSVRSVDCAPRDGSVRRWTCRLVDVRPRGVTTVTVRGNGSWSTDAESLELATKRQTTADGGYTGDFTTGAALLGCCVPVP
jgi:hypothetical protein